MAEVVDAPESVTSEATLVWEVVNNVSSRKLSDGKFDKLNQILVKLNTQFTLEFFKR